MTDFFISYMILWGLACVVAVGLMLRLHASLELFQKTYWAGLFQGWKVVIFVISATGMIMIAPYTGDPTWDYVDAAFMSILAYTTAPWAVAICYLFARRKRSFVNAYVAACIWMFSASWSYDLYLVIRDGYYPATWFANIFASSALYVSAGLMWNLEYVEGRGVIFGFMDDRWPVVSAKGQLNRLMWYALPLMVLVAAMIIPFLI